MTRACKALTIVLVATFGLWGCARGPSPANGGADRIKALEAKNARLEDDYRAATAVREQFRKRLQTVEEQRARALQQLERLQQACKERDILRAQLDTRTGERDALQAQYDQLRKGIRSLLSQAEAAMPTSTTPPVTSAAETPDAGKS